MALIGPGAIEIPPRAYGAIEDYIANLARELEALGYRVSILNRTPPLRSRRAREIVSAVALPFDLRGRSFDTLHAHSPITAEALSASGRPYVLTSHSRYWLTEPTGLDRLWRMRDTLAVRRATAVIALSPRVRPLFESIRSGTARPRVEVVPFGVDCDRFHPPPPGTPRLGVVGLGVVAAHKRWDILAAAARAAGVPARILGRIDDPRARSAARQLNPAVEFPGEVPAERLAEELGRARVYVHPSDMELASVATVQAMACGLPVVGSDLLEDIVTHGKDGFLVDHTLPIDERIAATAEYIRRLVADDTIWGAMAKRARATAVDEHSWPIIARRVADVYERTRSPPPSV
ncbi:MAG TPA: glycosyltransferase family 4 protein [Thermoplasmata archaeon]|nr:glycosyltransferase family 4 protein [Thermoplasmata archaeon]